MPAEIAVSAGFATIGQGAGPLMVTWKSGVFASHGLKIDKPRLMGGARGVVRGLSSGEIQFGNLAAPAALRANLKAEADIVFLTGGINQQFLIGRPGLRSREELAGKKIGFVGDGGLNDALVKIVMQRLAAQGVSGIDQQTVPAGGEHQLEPLLNGHCDALVMTPPESIIATRKGCRCLVDFGEYGLNYALGGIAAKRDYVERNPDITRRFIKSYVAGMHWYRTDKEFTVAVQAEYSGIQDRSIAEETYDLTLPGMPRAPYPVIPALQTLLKFMSTELPQAAAIDVRRFTDDRFVRELEQSGFIDSLDRESLR